MAKKLPLNLILIMTLTYNKCCACMLGEERMGVMENIAIGITL
jgi:hypothetical protein